MTVPPQQHPLVGVVTLQPVHQADGSVSTPDMVVFSRPVEQLDGDVRLSRPVDTTLEQFDKAAGVIPPVSDHGVDPGLVPSRNDFAHRRSPSPEFGPHAAHVLADKCAVRHQDQADPRFSQTVTDTGHPVSKFTATGFQRLAGCNQFVRRTRWPVAVLLVAKMIVVRHVGVRADCTSRLTRLARSRFFFVE